MSVRPDACLSAGARRHAGALAARRCDRGAVTAETMVVLPLLVAVTLGLVWLVSLAGTHVRVVDAAREVARAAARDEPAAAAVALGRRVAPAGAEISVRDEGPVVIVDVTATVRSPRGLLGFLPPLPVRGEAVAAREQP